MNWQSFKRYAGEKAAPAMSPIATHPRTHAYEIRARVLATAGHPEVPTPELASSIAEEIRSCCGCNGVRAFRFAYGWTVKQAVEQLHEMCVRDRLGTRGTTDRSWKQWEEGKGHSADSRDLLCRLFRTGPVQLGLGVDYTPRAVGETTKIDGIVVPTADLWGDMHRRTFVGGTATLAMGWHVEGITSALTHARGTDIIGADTLTDLSGIAAAYRRSYRSTPAPQLLSTAVAHLELALAIRPQHQPNDGRRTGLFSVVGEMAALAGVILLLDQGKPELAASYISLAWACAENANSNDLRAIVLGGRSFAAGYVQGDHRAGLELAEAALTVAQTGTSSETRGWVAAVASERAASLGDVAQCKRYLDAARVALADTSNGTPSLGIGVFDSSKLDAYEGGDMVRLGRYAEAEPALNAAIDHLAPSMRRHRCTAFIDRAEARLGAGDVDAACEDATEALDLVAQVRHIGNAKRLRGIAQRAKESGAASGRLLWTEVVTATSDPKGFPA